MICSFCRHYRPVRNVSDLPAWAQEEHRDAYGEGVGYDMNDNPWGECRRNAPVADANSKPLWPIMFYEEDCSAFEDRA